MTSHTSMPLCLLALALAGCSNPRPNRDPTGEAFPEVEATSLSGEAVELPATLAGSRAVLLVGYVQNAQFDCDRWILGLMQAETPVPLYEIPTIEGMVPGMFAGSINNGMRNGIPEEDWGSVLTVYGDAGDIVRLTGKENPRNARVFLLNEHGEIAWFHDRGYSAGKLMELDRLCR